MRVGEKRLQLGVLCSDVFCEQNNTKKKTHTQKSRAEEANESTNLIAMPRRVLLHVVAGHDRRRVDSTSHGNRPQRKRHLEIGFFILKIGGLMEKRHK